MNPKRRVCGLDDATTGAKLEMRRMWTLGMRELKYLGECVVQDWFRHRVPRLGASLAFYTLLSLAPLLVVILGIAGLAFGRQAAEGQLVWQIQELVGRKGAEAIQLLIQHASNPAAGGLATVVGVVTLFFGASAVVTELRDALNVIWGVPAKSSAFGWRSVAALLKERTVSFAVVLAVGFLLLVSLVINASIAAMGSRFQLWFAVPEAFVQTVNTLISFVVITILFAALFKVLPDLHIRWSDVVLGAIGTSFLFTIGKLLIGIYLGKASFISAYGAAGSLVIVLIWVYYSAQIFFLGAEFTQAYANCFGSQPVERAKRQARLLTPQEKPVDRPVETKLEVPGEVRPTHIEV
jgi:membrane protein